MGKGIRLDPLAAGTPCRRPHLRAKRLFLGAACGRVFTFRQKVPAAIGFNPTALSRRHLAGKNGEE